MRTLKRLITATMSWIWEMLSTLQVLINVLVSRKFVTFTLDGEEITMNNNLDISLEDIAEALADLTMEVKVLEAKVQRLSEFRDIVGHVPIYENGGKQ